MTLWENSNFLMKHWNTSSAKNVQGKCRLSINQSYLRLISRDKKIDYKILLKEILVNKKDIEQVISEYGGK